MDKTLRSWTSEGAALNSYDDGSAPAELVVAKLSSGVATGCLVQGCLRVWSTRVSVAVGNAAWNATAQLEPRVFLPDGTVVVTCTSGHVFCLELFMGIRRVVAAEAAEIEGGVDTRADAHARELCGR